jgi:hypothetical protein
MLTVRNPRVVPVPAVDPTLDHGHSGGGDDELEEGNCIHWLT